MNNVSFSIGNLPEFNMKMLPEGNHNNNTSISTCIPISIGGGVISSNSVSIDSTKLDRIHRAQSEMKMSVMELTRVVADIYMLNTAIYDSNYIRSDHIIGKGVEG